MARTSYAGALPARWRKGERQASQRASVESECEHHEGNTMSRIFNSSNCLGATVYDVETMQKLGQVMSVDIDRAEVVRLHEPIRVVGDEIATYTERYRAIHPIYGGNLWPQLFHCYGRQAG